MLAFEIEKLINEKKLDKFNLISCSMSGIDARVMMEENPVIKQKVNKFISVGSPNNGSVLGNAIDEKKIEKPVLNQLNGFLGVHYECLNDVSLKGMSEINEVLEDLESDSFFTVTGDKMYEDLNGVMKEVN